MIFVHEVRRKMSEETPRPIMLYVEDAPSVDTEPVIRCEECKYFKYGNGCILQSIDYEWEEQMYANDFCSRGERRDDNKDSD